MFHLHKQDLCAEMLWYSLNILIEHQMYQKVQNVVIMVLKVHTL